MSKCENCIHYETCEDWALGWIGSNSCFPYECEGDIKPCEFYKDKSLFVELPVNVGQKVYRTKGNFCNEKIFEGVVDQIAIYNNREIRFWVYGHPLSFVCDDIGKTVFLTKEEAEAKLKEIGE